MGPHLSQGERCRRDKTQGEKGARRARGRAGHSFIPSLTAQCVLAPHLVLDALTEHLVCSPVRTGAHTDGDSDRHPHRERTVPTELYPTWGRIRAKARSVTEAAGAGWRAAPRPANGSLWRQGEMGTRVQGTALPGAGGSSLGVPVLGTQL